MRIPKKALLLAVQRGINVADAFSTTLYTGNGSTQTITNGIDLASEGGLVWSKSRSDAHSHGLVDTARGGNSALLTNATNAAASGTWHSFLSTGYTIDTSVNNWNASGSTYASWTFRQAPKFFDIVQYTGDGISGRQIAHDLGVAPGMILIKDLSVARSWVVYHRASDVNAYDYYMNLNTPEAKQVSGSRFSGSGSFTDGHFTLGINTDVNGAGENYIAYLFAHDPENSGIIQCGSFDVNGTGSDKITTGWPVQYLLFKYATRTGDWEIADTKRTPLWSGDEAYLEANNNDAELLANFASNEPDGVTLNGFTATGEKVIYMAIRAPE